MVFLLLVMICVCLWHTSCNTYCQNFIDKLDQVNRYWKFMRILYDDKTYGNIPKYKVSQKMDKTDKNALAVSFV